MKMEKICTAQMMRELDRAAIQDHGIPGVVLMENAARGAFEMLMELFAPLNRVSIFCGKGNNGGDGFVIARHLLNAGLDPEVFLLAPQEEITGDAKTNLDILTAMEAPVFEVLDIDQLNRHYARIMDSDLIVDAILGTGLTSDVRGFYSEVIELINELTNEVAPIPVLAVDLPSGLSADSGQIMGSAVQATATATFGLAKLGQFLYPGPELTGELEIIEISIPTYLFESVPYHAVTEDGAADLIEYRPTDAHKGQGGHLLLLAGSPGKTGAAVLAADAALHTGAGLVTLGIPAGLSDIFEAKTLEVMTEPLPDTADRSLGPESIGRTLDLMEGRKALALGPGLGRHEGAVEFVREIIKNFHGPMLIDADGLNAVAEDLSMLKQQNGQLILTPHPGEMSRLTGKSVSDIQADRLNTALAFAEEHQVILVLKGAHTITAEPNGSAFINLSGNPGMASAGMGDVLTGVIAALLAQDYDPLEAAVLGTFLHGMAGDISADDLGEIGIVASDLIPRLPEALEILSGLEYPDDDDRD